MVQISIHALRNLNYGGRSFPHSGYLGLTKVVVEGVVRTRIEDDRKQMAASSVTISVKCYEARTKLTYSRINTLVDATVVLWSSPVYECTDIGDMDLPFRVVLPSTVTGHSNLIFPEYRIFWRLEAGEQSLFLTKWPSRENHMAAFIRASRRSRYTLPANARNFACV
jgi:hypothetical protein